MTIAFVLAVLFFGSVMLIMFLVKKNEAKLKGWGGEMLLLNMLKKALDPSKYTILHDIMLPTEEGETTQIDHIVVSQWGIFVVEQKTFTDARIFGREGEPTWTAKYGRNTTHSFQNPLRQNYLHILTIAKRLGLSQDYFKTIVAFGGSVKFKTKLPPTVMHLRDVANYIVAQSQTPVILAEQVPEVVAAIQAWQNTLTSEQKAAHVENLHKRHAASRSKNAKAEPVSPLSPMPASPCGSVTEAQPVPPPSIPVSPCVEDAEASAEASPPNCPKCGAPMILRSRKSDGGKFWGCSNYPKCHGIIPGDA